jgi:macrolide-specific efflux system membrane fusion protein
VLTLPASALGKPVPDKDQDDSRAYMVRVPNGKTAQDKLIYVGLSNRSVAEIRSGLQDGDQVLPPSADTASDGKAKSNMPRMGPRL